MLFFYFMQKDLFTYFLQQIFIVVEIKIYNRSILFCFYIVLHKIWYKSTCKLLTAVFIISYEYCSLVRLEFSLVISPPERVCIVGFAHCDYNKELHQACRSLSQRPGVCALPIQSHPEQHPDTCGSLQSVTDAFYKLNSDLLFNFVTFLRDISDDKCECLWDTCQAQTPVVENSLHIEVLMRF